MNKPLHALLRTAVVATAFSVLMVTTAGFQASSAEDMKSWQRKVAQLIASKHVYPRAAQAREIEGTARVRITISRTGEILSSEIVEKTGHDILDAAIPKVVEKINPLPAPPAEMSDDQLTFIIPISWRLG